MVTFACLQLSEKNVGKLKKFGAQIYTFILRTDIHNIQY